MNDIMTSPEAAEYLRTARSTLSRMRREGGGPPWFTTGTGPRSYRYRRSQLDAWIEARTVGAEALTPTG